MNSIIITANSPKEPNTFLQVSIINAISTTSFFVLIFTWLRRGKYGPTWQHSFLLSSNPRRPNYASKPYILMSQVSAYGENTTRNSDKVYYRYFVFVQLQKNPLLSFSRFKLSFPYLWYPHFVLETLSPAPYTFCAACHEPVLGLFVFVHRMWISVVSQGSRWGHRASNPVQL